MQRTEHRNKVEDNENANKDRHSRAEEDKTEQTEQQIMATCDLKSDYFSVCLS